MTSRLEKRLSDQKQVHKKRIVILTAAILIFALVAGASYLWFDRGLKGVPGLGALSGKVNILVLGVDERTNDVGRSDTLFLLTVDSDTKDVKMLSIPRDTRVKIPGHGWDKINHAYADGGIDLTKETVEELLGIKIDYKVKVNFAGFYKLVDAVGGVDIDVEKSMHYSDPYDANGGLYIDLSPGMQHLDGKKAIQYVRYRDEQGDIGRVERQQKFIKAMLNQVATPAVIPRIPAIIAEVSSAIETDMSTNDMLKLAQLVNDANKRGLKTYMVPGKPAYIKEISYWLPDMVVLRQAVAEITGQNWDGRIVTEAQTSAGEYDQSVPAEMKVADVPTTPAKTDEKSTKADSEKDKQKADEEKSTPKPASDSDTAKLAKPPVPGKLKASIVNASGNPEAGEKMAETLRSQGFDVGGISAGANVMSNTVVISNTLNGSVVTRLTSLPFKYVLRVTKDDAKASDFTVVIGSDYNQ